MLGAFFLISALKIANEYRVIGNIYRQHEAILSEASKNGATEIYLPEYMPNNESYIFTWRCPEEYYLPKFREFYKLDSEAKVFYFWPFE